MSRWHATVLTSTKTIAILPTRIAHGIRDSSLDESPTHEESESRDGGHDGQVQVNDPAYPAGESRGVQAISRTDGMPVSESVRVAIDQHIAARRKDKNFQERLKRRIEEDKRSSSV